MNWASRGASTSLLAYSLLLRSHSPYSRSPARSYPRRCDGADPPPQERFSPEADTPDGSNLTEGVLGTNGRPERHTESMEPDDKKISGATTSRSSSGVLPRCLRFTSPGSNASAVVLNWQRGLTERHDVPASLAAGAWTINGVRAHQIETDHTGNFFPVSATITVTR